VGLSVTVISFILYDWLTTETHLAQGGQHFEVDGAPMSKNPEDSVQVDLVFTKTP